MVYKAKYEPEADVLLLVLEMKVELIMLKKKVISKLVETLAKYENSCCWLCWFCRSHLAKTLLSKDSLAQCSL